MRGIWNKDLSDQFIILKKCRRKLDCLIYDSIQLKQNFLFDSPKAPRSVFVFIDYFYLLIIRTETFTRTFTR